MSISEIADVSIEDIEQEDQNDQCHKSAYEAEDVGFFLAEILDGLLVGLDGLVLLGEADILLLEKVGVIRDDILHTGGDGVGILLGETEDPIDGAAEGDDDTGDGFKAGILRGAAHDLGDGVFGDVGKLGDILVCQSFFLFQLSELL